MSTIDYPLRLSPIASPKSISEHFTFTSNDLQSNLASIRTSEPDAALIGLGLEYLIEPTLDNGLRNNFYTPFSMPGFFQPLPSSPPKRDYQSTRDSKDNLVLGRCSSAWSPSLNSLALPPSPHLPLAMNGTNGTELLESNPNRLFYSLSAASGLSPNILATHISASADITLNLLSDNQADIPYFGTINDNQFEQLPVSPCSIPRLPTPEIVLPIADINMRELKLANQGTILGVDPTAIFLDYSNLPVPPFLPLPDYCCSPDSSFADSEDNDNDCDEDVYELSFEDDVTGSRPTDGAQGQDIPEAATDGANGPPPLGVDNAIENRSADSVQSQNISGLVTNNASLGVDNATENKGTSAQGQNIPDVVSDGVSNPPSSGADNEKPTDGTQSQGVPEAVAAGMNDPLSLGGNHDEGATLAYPLGEAKREEDTCEDYEPSEYEPSVLESPSDQEYVPSISNFTPSRIVKRKLARETSQCTAFDQYPHSTQQENVNSNVNLGTPVINAHFGIPLSELQEKADRYRLRNNIPLTSEIELVYDKRWLLAFVGKLSQQGELIHEFRCYVIGCPQTNKRRDHILIHLGGHLGHRPFKCSVCPSRFLRKNECKRHELSHTGERPFTCDLCLIGFVRQDLLKRHMNRTHGSTTPSSKRKKGGIDSKRPTKKTKAR